MVVCFGMHKFINKRFDNFFGLCTSKLLQNFGRFMSYQTGVLQYEQGQLTAGLIA